ncbi:MAG: acylphosphatase [Anaerolineales bacterium]
MQDHTQLHARVRGRVQGVGFRYFVRQQAAAFPITGWVRNISDGWVELLAEGTRADLETVLEAVRRGPPGALVDEVAADWRPASGDWTTFSIAPTE